MSKVETKLELKNVIVGLYKYQLEQLRQITEAEGYSSSEIIRKAIDLWFRAFALKGGEDGSEGSDL